MTFGLGTMCYAVAAILALLAAIPPVPGASVLLALAVMFISLGHILP